MNRRQAIQLLHDRHPHVIDPPVDEIDLEMLHLELFWFHGHVCDRIDEGSDRSVKRAFQTIHTLAVEGDEDVRSSVVEDFLSHVNLVSDIEWARKLMPPSLAEASRVLERRLRELERG